MLKAVTTLTPHRISFAGGGTDIPNFYRENEGSVLNTAINKYLYVTVHCIYCQIYYEGEMVLGVVVE